METRHFAGITRFLDSGVSTKKSWLQRKVLFCTKKLFGLLTFLAGMAGIYKGGKGKIFVITSTGVIFIFGGMNYLFEFE